MPGKALHLVLDCGGFFHPLKIKMGLTPKLEVLFLLSMYTLYFYYMFLLTISKFKSIIYAPIFLLVFVEVWSLNV